jgi:CRP-like cAMP-binding protein
MEMQQLSDIFSLFHNVESDILERFLSIANQEESESGEVIVDEESWGKAMYFVLSGWVKIESIYQDKNITVEIIGRGGFFGEEGIFSHNVNNVINSRVTTISNVELLVVSAQRFIQFLYQYTQIQNRLLGLTVSKVKEYQKYCQFYRQTMKVRLVTILISLAETYGEITEQGIKIYNFLCQDLADLAQLPPSECHEIMNKLEKKNLIEIDSKSNSIFLPNLKLLHHIIGKLGNS